MYSVYLDNGLAVGQTTDDNLRVIIQQLDNGQRTKSTIFAMLRGMGIPEDKALFAIKHFTRKNCQHNKNNNHNMKFNLTNLQDILGAVHATVINVQESNVNSINYSANSSKSILDSILREIHDINEAFKAIKENSHKPEVVEEIKEKLHPAVLASRPEFYLLNKSYNLLKPYNEIKVVNEFLEKAEFIIKENLYTNYISNLIYEMLDLQDNKFYTESISDLQFLLNNDEKYIKENLSVLLNKHNWIPAIQQLLEYNSTQTSKLVSNNNATVERVFSPVLVNEDKSFVFLLDNNFYKANTDKTLEKVTDANLLSEKFLRICSLLNEYKVEENKITLYNFNNSLEIITESETLTIDDIKVRKNDFENVKNTLVSSAFFRLDEMNKIDDVLLLIENLSLIKELDIVDRIIGKNGNIVNIIKLSESNIYINRIAPSVLINELYKADNSTQAQQIVNEYVNYDISKSIYSILKHDEKVRVQLNESITVIENRITFLNEQLSKVTDANKDLNNTSLNEAIKLLEDEIRKQNVEIEKLYNQKANLS